MKRLFLIACLANAALAAPALAQQADATDGLGSVSSASSFGRDRATAVLERSRPDYTPEPLRISTLEVMPRLSLGAGYDDNIFALNSDTIKDAYVRIRPRISITRPSPNLELSLNGELDMLRYADRASENTTQYAVGAGARYTISSDTILNLKAGTGRYAQERVSPDSPTGVTRPVRFQINEGNATLSHTFNRLRVTGVMNVENRNYTDGYDPAGNVVDQDFRDQTTITTTGISEYALSPSLALFVAGAYNWRDYRDRTGPVPARDSTGYEIGAGASFELGIRMRGALRLGYLSQNYKSPLFQDVSGLLVRGELAYFLTPLVTLNATIDRGVRETGISGATGYLATVTTVRADYELLRNLILSAGADLEKRDFNNVDRKDDRWTYRASASYLVNRRVTLRADFQRRTQSSNGALAGRQFGDNRISMGVTLSGI